MPRKRWGRGRGWLDMPVAKAGWLWWDAKEEEQKVLCNGYIILNDDFFKTILANPVPVRMMALLALKNLHLALISMPGRPSNPTRHSTTGKAALWHGSCCMSSLEPS